MEQFGRSGHYVSALATNATAAQIVGWKSNNSLLWAWSLPNIGTNGNGSYSAPTLSADGTNVYVGTELGVVYCLDATTNSTRIRWTNNVTYKVRSQLALSADGTVLYVRTGDTTSTNDSKLIALNAINGTNLWASSAALGDKLPTTRPFHTFSMASGPVVTGNSNIYLGTATGHVLGFNSATGTNVFDLNLASTLTPLYLAATGDTNTPRIEIEASPALGTNGWVYVATRDLDPSGTSQAFSALVALNPALSGTNSIQWVAPVGTDDPQFDKGMIASPILDRAGFVYATDWGHHIEQFDALVGVNQSSGLPYRVWNSSVGGSDLSGKNYQTPALTEDGLLIVCSSGVTNFDSTFDGRARILALRSEGQSDASASLDLPLWETATSALDVLDTTNSLFFHPNYYGSPAIASAGYIYVADDLGRVLRFAGKTPLMAGPWPSLGGGNAHPGHLQSYAWNVVRLYGYGGSSSSVNTIDNANRTIGTSYSVGGFYEEASFWNPLSASVVGSTNAFGAASDTSGNVLVSVPVGSSYEVGLFPLGAYTASPSLTTLALPSVIVDYNGNTVTNVTASGIGIAETGSLFGNLYGSAGYESVMYWQFDGSTWVANSVTPPPGNQAWANAVSLNGWAVGKANFDGPGGVQRLFLLQPDFPNFSSVNDYGSLADTSGTTVTNRSSVGWDLKEDFGIVGEGQNTSGIERAFFTPCSLPTSGSHLTTDAALPGLYSGTNTTWTSAAYSIGRNGTLVGYAQLASGGSFYNHAAMWTLPAGKAPVGTNFVCTDLNTLLPGGSGWTLQTATMINDSGFIIGMGTVVVNQTAVTAPFLLYPARGTN